MLPLLPFVFVHNPYSWLALLGAMLPWPLRLARRGYLTRRTSFDQPIVLVLLGCFLGLFVSFDRQLSFQGLTSYLAGVVTYYVLVNNPRFLRLFLVYLFAFALAATLWVFSQGSVGLNKFTSFNGWAYQLAAPLPKITDLPAQPNALSGFMLIVIPIALALTVYASSRRQRTVAGLITFFFTAALVLTGSRAGLIGLFLAGCFVLFWRCRWVLILVPLLVALLLLMNMGHLGPLDQMWENPWASTAGGRLEIWGSTLAMLPHLLFTGTGPGNYAQFYPFYSPPSYVLHPLSETITNPHNALLQLWADAGLGGVLATVYALVAGFRLAKGLFLLPKLDRRYGIAVGLLGAVVGATVYGTFESAITAVWTDAPDRYHAIASPLPWCLAGLIWIIFSRLQRDPVAEREELNLSPRIEQPSLRRYSYAPVGDRLALRSLYPPVSSDDPIVEIAPSPSGCHLDPVKASVAGRDKDTRLPYA